MSKEQRYQKRIRAMALLNLGGRCAHCGTTDNLEIHHMFNDGWRDRVGGYTRSYVLRASKGETFGLQCLCKKCHIAETKKVDWRILRPQLLQLDQRYTYLVG